MTCCLALKLDAGLVMLSDTRTSASVDNVSRFGKMFTREVAGERTIRVMTAGNLSLTQSVMTAIDDGIDDAAAEGDDRETIPNAASMNLIEATADAPNFQIGEHKYGQPILDRVIQPGTSLGQGLKAAFVSMDSTLRWNLSVGMPLDLAAIRTETLGCERRRRIEADDTTFLKISHAWSERLRESFEGLPAIAEE